MRRASVSCIPLSLAACHASNGHCLFDFVWASALTVQRDHIYNLLFFLLALVIQHASVPETVLIVACECGETFGKRDSRWELNAHTNKQRQTKVGVSTRRNLMARVALPCPPTALFVSSSLLPDLRLTCKAMHTEWAGGSAILGRVLYYSACA